MDVGRECIFLGYTATASQYRLYAPDLHRVVVSSYTKFKEDIRGSSIIDLKLWRRSGLEFIEGQGDSAPAVRNPIGRPAKSFKSTSFGDANGGYNYGAATTVNPASQITSSSIFKTVEAYLSNKCRNGHAGETGHFKDFIFIK